MDPITIITAVSALYPILIYILPPEYAAKLKPIGCILKYLAETPGGLKTK